MPESPDIRYAVERLFRTAFPKLTVTAPAPGILVDRDVAVPMRDGTTLRANVFRPARGGRFPVVMCAHPYGKDGMPKRTPFGYLPLARYRFMRQPERVAFSAYTTWEAPDPSYWVPRGYVMVNLDLRGFGTSEGEATLLSDQEAADYAEAGREVGRHGNTPRKGTRRGRSEATCRPGLLGRICGDQQQSGQLRHSGSRWLVGCNRASRRAARGSQVHGTSGRSPLKR